MSAAVIASAALTPLGRGVSWLGPTEVGEPPRTRIARDDALCAAGLERPWATRCVLPGGHSDPASALLLAALDDLVAELKHARPGVEHERLGLFLGTSSGGMASAEQFFAARAAPPVDPVARRRLARAATYFAPFDEAREALGGFRLTCSSQALAACAASTVAMGLAMRALALGLCDVAIAGGYDALTTFVASGFEALRATTARGVVSPFRQGRDGVALGEGAGLVALVRADDARDAARFWLTGFGCTNDAVHLTAPDRTGAGLARALELAVAESGARPEAVGLVSAHGTATPFNDAMEARALARALPGARPVVHAMKAEVGHLLGAAGVVELLAATGALSRGLVPGAAGEGDPDPEASVWLLEAARASPTRHVAKLSAAFGGTNAALVASLDPPSWRRTTPRDVRVLAHTDALEPDAVFVATQTGASLDRVTRLDDFALLAATACARLAARVGSEALRGAGVVVGTSLATLDTNARYDARRRARGARFVEPRLFPYTSPNAAAGECALLFGLTGASFAVGSGWDAHAEALFVARTLVVAGDLDRVVVVVADELGPASADLVAWWGAPLSVARGAVALLLEASTESPDRNG